MPYGYEPSDYRKNYGFVAGAANALASGVIGLSEEQKRKEAMEAEYAKAEKLAAEKKELINYSYKTLRNLASRKIDKLIELGEIKPEEKRVMLKVLVQPDKFTNFKDYYQVNGTAFDELNKSLDEKITKAEQLKTDTGIKQTIEGGAQQPAIGFQNPETEAVAGDLGASMADLTKASEATQQTQSQGPWAELGEEAPATQQQPIQAIGQQQPAKLPTKEEAARMMAGKYTKGEAEGSLAYGSLKSEADIAKEAQAKDKADLAAQNLELRKRRMDMDKNREDRLAKNDAVARARLALDTKKFEFVQSSQVGKELDNKLKLFVNSDVAVAEAEGTIEEMENKIEDLKVRAGSREAKFDSAVAEQIEKEIGEITGKLASERKNLRSLIDKSIKLEGEYDKATLAYDRFVENEINKEGLTSEYTKAKAGIGKPKEAPAPAPSPSGSGTPAPVIGGASPKLPPRTTQDTVIQGGAPLQGAKKYSESETRALLKRKGFSESDIEAYVQNKKKKGLL